MINCAVLFSILFLHRALNPEHQHGAGQVSMLTQFTCTNLPSKHRPAADGAARRWPPWRPHSDESTRRSVDWCYTHPSHRAKAWSQRRAVHLSYRDRHQGDNRPITGD